MFDLYWDFGECARLVRWMHECGARMGAFVGSLVAKFLILLMWHCWHGDCILVCRVAPLNSSLKHNWSTIMTHIQTLTISLSITEGDSSFSTACCIAAVRKARELQDEAVFFQHKLNLTVSEQYIAEQKIMQVDIKLAFPVSYADMTIEERAMKQILHVGGDALLSACTITAYITKTQ